MQVSQDSKAGQPHDNEAGSRKENSAGCPSISVEPSFRKSIRYWHERASRLGDGYVGRINESWQQQQKNIEKLLKAKLGTSYYPDVMDYGCGWGRFIPFLNEYSGHIWAVDFIESMLQRAGEMAINVTTISPKMDATLEFPSESIDLIVIVSVLHFITDDDVFNICTQELVRVAKPGARFLVIDNNVDKDYHVKPRPETQLVEALRLKNWKAEKVTVNKRPLDHLLIDGVKNA